MDFNFYTGCSKEKSHRVLKGLHMGLKYHIIPNLVTMKPVSEIQRVRMFNSIRPKRSVVYSALPMILEVSQA